MGQLSGYITLVDVSDGAPGLNNATIYLYKRSETTPSTKPTGNLTYTFSTNSIAAVEAGSSLNGWEQNVNNLSGTNPLYFIVATASSTTDTDIIASTEWQGPALLAESGDDGKGISTTTITYGVSNSSTTEPSNWVSTVPTLNQGDWLWVRTVYTYTDTTTSQFDTKTYVGTDGQDGSSITITSSTKVNGVTTVTFSDGTTVQIADGEDGDNGQPGQPGADGRTPYTHFAWANSSDGTVDFSTTVSSGKQYIGVYSDYTEADSQTSGDYSWTLIKGEPGIDGYNQAIIYLYQRVNNTPNPAAPAGNLTYTFSSGNLSGNLGSWSREIPSNTNGYPCYVISATAISRTNSDTIASSDWSSPVILVEDGNDGLSPTVTSTTNGIIVYDPVNDVSYTITNGASGTSYYTHIRYSSKATPTSASDVSTSSDGKTYIGIQTTTSSNAPAWNDTNWHWTKYVGSDGTPAVQYYAYIKYATDSNGSNMRDTPAEGYDYVGTYTGQAENPAANQYNWSKYIGEDGTPATQYYAYVKYATDSNGTGMQNSPDSTHIYVGTYAGTVENPSANLYNWSKYVGDDGVSITGVVPIYYLQTPDDEGGGDDDETTSSWSVGAQPAYTYNYHGLGFDSNGMTNVGAYIVSLGMTTNSPRTGTILGILHDSNGTKAWVYNGTSIEQINNFSTTFSCDANMISISVSEEYYFNDAGANYILYAVYGGSGDISFNTTTYSPSSGQTSAQFSVSENPFLYFCALNTTVQLASYHRVATVAKYEDENLFYGINFYTNTLGAYDNFTESYSNGTLTISSSGTNGGGYFHNPGTYTLYYLCDEDLIVEDENGNGAGNNNGNSSSGSGNSNEQLGPPTKPANGVTITETGVGTNQWTKSIPTYVADGIYYTCVQVFYTSSPSPISSDVVLDQALTISNSNAASALTQATAANNATALLGGHFIYTSQTYGTTPPSANVVQVIEDDGDDVTYIPTAWGYNTHIGANGIRLRHNEIVLSEWNTSGLSFYNPSTHNADVTLDTNGLNLIHGGIKAGTAGSNGFIYLSTNSFSDTISGHTSGTIPIDNYTKTNWRQIIGTKFAVDADGNLYANNAHLKQADVEGAITATSLTIGSGANSYDGATAINITGYDIEIVSDSTGVLDEDVSTYLYPHLYHNGTEVEAYILSEDTEVDGSKTYYTRSGTEGSYIYTEVVSPTGNPHTSNYYEQQINYSHFVWYQDNDAIGTAGDSSHYGRYLATYGHTYRVIYEFSEGAVNGGIEVQDRYIDPAKYITKIDDTGITIHPETWTNESSYIRLNEDGMNLFDSNNDSIAFYGNIARIGKEDDYNAVVNPMGFEINDDVGNNVFSIVASTDSTSRTVKKGYSYNKDRSGTISAPISSTTITFKVKDGANGTWTSTTKTNAQLPIGSSFNLGNFTFKRIADNHLYVTYSKATGNGYLQYQYTISTNYGKVNFTGNNNILCNGAWYMTSGQDIDLSESVTDQLNGIVLCWSAYVNGAAQDYEWNYTFVPKDHVIRGESEGVSSGLMTTGYGSGMYVGTKYVYVYDTHIKGNDINTSVGTQAGITFTNNHWVLRYVLGV